VSETDLMPQLRRWWWVLLAATVIGGASAYAAATTLAPSYRAEARLLVGPLNASQSTIEAAGKLGRTYAELAKSRPVVAAALDRARQSADPDDLIKDGKLDATANEISRLVTVEAERGSRVAAADLANAVARRLVEESRSRPIEQNEALETFRTSRALSRLKSAERADVIEAAERTIGEAMVGRLQIVDPARPPRDPAGPRKNLLAAMGAIAGLLLAATVIVLYAAGGAARDDDTGTAGHRHLGVVATPSPPGALAVEADPDSDAAARYRVLAARATGRNGSGARSIVVVDSGDEETRGVVAGNIAAAVAEAGRSVVLVDATATGGVTDLLGLRDAEGYADMDPNGGRLNDELEGRLIEYSGRLTVLPRGHSVPRDMMAHDRLRALLALLHERADVVVVSTSPVDRSPSALGWAEVADAAMLVVDERADSEPSLTEALDALSAKSPAVTTVLARRSRQRLRAQAHTAND